MQRVLEGDQYMTVYKAIRPEAERAAELAVDLLRGHRVAAPTTTDNGAGRNVLARSRLMPASAPFTLAERVLEGGRFSPARSP